MYHVDDFYHIFIYKNVQDLDEFKTILKPRLKLIVQNDEREWFIVFVSKAHPSNDQATKMAKKVYARLEADFNTKKRERYYYYFYMVVLVTFVWRMHMFSVLQLLQINLLFSVILR
jgi:hypothetical protein